MTKKEPGEAAVPADDSVEFVGKGTDETGAHFAQFAVNGTKLAPTPFASIANRDGFFGSLNAAGAKLFQISSRQRFLAKIEASSPRDTFIVATRVGWHSGTSFVLPGRILGQSRVELQQSLGHLPPEMLTKFGEEGTLQEWQSQILPLCAGNSRFIFAVCAAFASSVATLLPEAKATGGFQFFGEPESGKTTAAIVAGSVWGNHLPPDVDNGFLEVWHSTAAKLADTLAAHADVGLVLDELSYFSGDVHQAVMQIASGAGRQRLNQIGRITYRCFVLSTSNKPLWQYPGSVGVSLGAVLSRLTDIPVPTGGAGIFEALHEFANGSELADALTSMCHAQHGTAGPAFIEAILNSERDTISKRARRFRARYKKRLTALAESENLKPLKRPLDRFATVYAAGRLASELGIISWSKQEVREAVLSCHLDALRVASVALPGTQASAGVSASASIRLLDYLKKHRRDFLDLDRTPLTAPRGFGSAPGYIAKMKGQTWWYFPAERFKEIAGGSRPARELMSRLRAHRLAPKGKDLTVQRPIFRGKKGNKGWRRVVAIRARSLKRYRKLLE